MNSVVSEILPGVRLRVLETARFKTCCMSISFIQKLMPDSAPKNAVIPRVLRRGTANLPDMEALSAALDELYGARIEPSVRKIGDLSVSGFICDFVSCVSKSEKQLEGVTRLLGEILLAPRLENNTFCSDFVDGELFNLSDEIRALINEKLSYSMRRANSLLFKGSGFGLSELGDISEIEMLSPEALYKHYNYLLSNAPIEIFFCGNYGFDTVKEALLSALSKLPLSRRTGVSVSIPDDTLISSRDVTEYLDMNQAVMIVALKAGNERNYTALQVLSAVLGGGTSSKLFENVRERASLCYYTGTQFDRFSNTVFIYCGIDPANIEKTSRALMRQFNACADGEITEDELGNAKKYLIEQLKTTDDSPVLLENYWIRENAAETGLSPAETANELSRITLRDVVGAANSLSKAITYTLTGKVDSTSEKRLLP